MRTPTPYTIHPNRTPSRGRTRAVWAKREAAKPESVKARWAPEFRSFVERMAKTA